MKEITRAKLRELPVQYFDYWQPPEPDDYFNPEDDEACLII